MNRITMMLTLFLPFIITDSFSELPYMTPVSMQSDLKSISTGNVASPCHALGEFRGKCGIPISIRAYNTVCNTDILDKEEAFQRRLWALKCNLISEDTIKDWYQGSTIENSRKYPAIFIDNNIYKNNNSEKFDKNLIHVFSSAYPRSGYSFITQKFERLFRDKNLNSPPVRDLYYFDKEMCQLPEGLNRYVTCNHAVEDDADKMSLVNNASQSKISDLRREYALNLKVVDREELSLLKANKLIPIIKNGRHIANTFEEDDSLNESLRLSFFDWESWNINRKFNAMVGQTLWDEEKGRFIRKK